MQLVKHGHANPGVWVLGLVQDLEEAEIRQQGLVPEVVGFAAQVLELGVDLRIMGLRWSMADSWLGVSDNLKV